MSVNGDSSKKIECLNSTIRALQREIDRKDSQIHDLLNSLSRLNTSHEKMARAYILLEKEKEVITEMFSACQQGKEFIDKVQFELLIKKLEKLM